MNTWNKERKRPRDRLLDYDATIVPPIPHTGGIPIVPSPIETDLFENIVWNIAQSQGFEGTEHDFWTYNLIKGTIDTFPIEGNSSNLYLDINTGILYYFEETYNPIYSVVK
jgi:hypothetical protein